jgi:uncharacterized protein
MTEILSLAQSNLLSPIVLCFVLGLIATLLRSDLRFPDALYQGLSIYLLFAIGLKGGAEFSEAPFAQVTHPMLAALIIGLITPLTAFAVLHYVARFTRVDSAALAAHYGSVSAVTFLAGWDFMHRAGQTTEAFLPALVAIMEIPGIVIAISLAGQSGGEAKQPALVSFQKILVGKSVLLLLGGFMIGAAAGKEGLQSVEGFFVSPFKGVLALFLLEMGIAAAQRLQDLRKAGIKLLLFAILAPIVHGCFGVWMGKWAGLSLGGSVILGLMSASASYITAPASVRSSLPDANPTLYLTASLGITFPFNLTLGIPLFYVFAQWLFG